ncbi:MAG: response regulator transcription factor [Lachnospiraceae bacterium]|jgi:DNA-binding LytR/AlgR family response regulator|uniref:LytR/AlgR family response regulator transcription factor n=1 Tax=Candidatus Merdisoma sp. JLR.KK006 TaxID=3112626 RepID=UPI002FEF5C6C|nr:response regulator transcription factor [Lachnospiraceae bacterium]
MYNIGICDDGENICTSIENMLLQYAQEKNIQVDTNVWYTGESLRDYLVSGGYLDILFLDIELFKMTGIEVGAYIRNQLDNMGLQIVYISGKASYAQQLFKTQPLDFLVKPIFKEQVDEVMDMALKIAKKRNERFEFQQGKDYYYILMGDIVYFESKGRKVKAVTVKAVFEFYGKLKKVAECLSEDFIVIHQSYIINKEYVFRYTYEMVELVDGTILTISPANRKSVRDRLLREE